MRSRIRRARARHGTVVLSVAIAVTMLAIPAAALYAAPPGEPIGPLEQEVVDLVNAERAKVDLPPLTVNYSLMEAAWNHKLRRVVYASSIHAVGMYPKNQFIDTEAQHRPDTFYGLSKCFAEDLGRLYWEKRQLESVCLRIYSCTPEPQNARALGSWLSYDDLIQLVEKSITTPVTGFTVAWGISNNDRAPVDNSRAAFLGYKPKDNAEDWADKIFARTPQLDPADAANMCHGGPFAVVPLGESGVAAIRKMSEGKS